MSDFRSIDPPDGSVTAWVTVAEAADTSGVDPSTVRQWYRSGRIPILRVEGERNAFLVPLHAVMALARETGEEGAGPGDAIDPGEAAIDLDASHWSARTDDPRAEATAPNDLTQARRELTAASDQLAFLRSQLAEAAEDARTFRNELAAMSAERDRLQHENERLRADVAALTEGRERVGGRGPEVATRRTVESSGSTKDDPWPDLPTDTDRGPVRPRRTTAPSSDALADLFASTRPDAAGIDPDAGEPALDDEPFVTASEATLEGDGAEADRIGGPRFAGFGHNDDDLLPQPGKKGRRGRK